MIKQLVYQRFLELPIPGQQERHEYLGEALMFSQKATELVGLDGDQEAIGNRGGSRYIRSMVWDQGVLADEVSITRKNQNRFLALFGHCADCDFAFLDEEQGLSRLACLEDGLSFREPADGPRATGLREHSSHIGG